MPLLSIMLSTVACAMSAPACDAQLVTGLDPRLIEAVCLVESGGNHKAYNPMDGKSPSFGACQIKLRTARYMGFEGTGDELMDPMVNYKYAAKYIQYQLKKHKDLNKALSAYNAGRPVSFNVAYVEKVLYTYRKLKESK